MPSFFVLFYCIEKAVTPLPKNHDPAACSLLNCGSRDDFMSALTELYVDYSIESRISKCQECSLNLSANLKNLTPCLKGLLARRTASRLGRFPSHLQRYRIQKMNVSITQSFYIAKSKASKILSILILRFWMYSPMSRTRGACLTDS